MLRRRLIPLLTIVIGAGVAHADALSQDRPGLEPPMAVPLAMALEDLRAAYREGVIEEEVTIFARSGGVSRRNRALVRIDRGRAIHIELGPLRVWAEEGVLRVVHYLDATRVFELEAPGASPAEAIRSALPPLPLPHLALALDDDETLATLTPYTPDIRWRSASAHFDAVVGRDLIIVEGAGENASVTMVLDAQTARLREMSLERESPHARFELRFDPASPTDPRTWPIGRGARTAVDALTSLGPIPGDVRPGDPAPDLLLLTRRGEAWRLHERRNAPLALLLFRESNEDALAGRDAARRAVGLGLERRWVVVMEAGGTHHFQRLATLAGVWGEDLFWSVSPQTTIDRFAPTASAAIVVVDRHNIVRAILPLDARAGDAEGIVREIREALNEMNDASDTPGDDPDAPTDP